jgi:tol-pal system protein YbgF
MKIPYFLILTACATNIYAGPPVLDSSTYGAGSVAAPVTTAPVSSQQTMPSYDQVTNLNKVQSDINDLKNKVQEQSTAIDYLQRTNADLQKRIADLGAGKAVDTSYKQPQLNSSAPAAPAAGNVTDEKDRYNRASAALKKGDYALAQQGFHDIITMYPSGDYADNAQYWIGVVLLNKGDKKGAIQAFDQVARTYPKSEKIPDALYKIGDTLLAMNNKPKAKEYFDYVIQNYPNTSGANFALKKKIAAKL